MVLSGIRYTIEIIFYYDFCIWLVAEEGVKIFVYFHFPLHDESEYRISSFSSEDSTKSSTISLSSRCFHYEPDSWCTKIIITMALISQKPNCSCSMWTYTNLSITTCTITAGIFDFFLSELDIGVIWLLVAVTRFKSNSNELRIAVCKFCSGKAERSLKSVVEQCSSE